MSDNHRNSLFQQNGGETVHPRIRSSLPSNQDIVEIDIDDDDDNDNDDGSRNESLVVPMQVASSSTLPDEVGSNPQSADESSCPNHQRILPTATATATATTGSSNEVIDLLEDDSEEEEDEHVEKSSHTSVDDQAARTLKVSSSSKAHHPRSSMGSNAELAISLDDSDEEMEDLPPTADSRASANAISLAQNIASLKALKAEMKTYGVNESSATASLKMEAADNEKTNRSVSAASLEMKAATSAKMDAKTTTTLQVPTSIDASTSDHELSAASPFAKKTLKSSSSKTLKSSPQSKQVAENRTQHGKASTHGRALTLGGLAKQTADNDKTTHSVSAASLEMEAATSEKKTKTSAILQVFTSIDASTSNDEFPETSPFAKKQSTSTSSSSKTLKSPQSKQVAEDRTQHGKASTRGLGKQDLLATALTKPKKRARSSNAPPEPDSSDDEQFGGAPRRIAAAAAYPPPMIVDLLDIDDDDGLSNSSPDCIDLVADFDSDNDDDDGYNNVPRGPLIRPFAQVRSPERSNRVIEIKDSGSEDDDDDDEIPRAAFSPRKASTREKMTARKGTQRVLNFPKQQFPSRKPHPPCTSESTTVDSTQRPHLIGASSSSVKMSPPPEDSTNLAPTQGESSQPRDVFRRALANGSNVDVREESDASSVAPRPQVQEPAVSVASGIKSIEKSSKASDHSIPTHHIQPQQPSVPQGNSSLASRGLNFARGLMSKVGSTMLHSATKDEESDAAGTSKQTDRNYPPMTLYEREEQDKSSESRQNRAPTMAPYVQTHPSSSQLFTSKSSSQEARTEDGNAKKTSASAMVPPPTVTTTPKASKTPHESKPRADSPGDYVPEEHAPSIGEAVKAMRMKRKREPTSRLTFDKFGTQKHGAGNETESEFEDDSSPAKGAVSFRAELESTASDASETSSTDLSELTSMTMIPHLSKTTVCKSTGLPIQYFTVHGFPDGKFLKFLATHLYPR
jgi:hypothetical protein